MGSVTMMIATREKGVQRWKARWRAASTDTGFGMKMPIPHRVCHYLAVLHMQAHPTEGIVVSALMSDAS